MAPGPGKFQGSTMGIFGLSSWTPIHMPKDDPNKKQTTEILKAVETNKHSSSVLQNSSNSNWAQTAVSLSNPSASYNQSQSMSSNVDGKFLSSQRSTDPPQQINRPSFDGGYTQMPSMQRPAVNEYPLSVPPSFSSNAAQMASMQRIVNSFGNNIQLPPSYNGNQMPSMHRSMNPDPSSYAGIPVSFANNSVQMANHQRTIGTEQHQLHAGMQASFGNNAAQMAALQRSISNDQQLHTEMMASFANNSAQLAALQRSINGDQQRQPTMPPSFGNSSAQMASMQRSISNEQQYHSGQPAIPASFANASNSAQIEALQRKFNNELQMHSGMPPSFANNPALSQMGAMQRSISNEQQIPGGIPATFAVAPVMSSSQKSITSQQPFQSGMQTSYGNFAPVASAQRSVNNYDQMPLQAGVPPFVPTNQASYKPSYREEPPASAAPAGSAPRAITNNDRTMQESMTSSFPDGRESTSNAASQKSSQQEDITPIPDGSDLRARFNYKANSNSPLGPNAELSLSRNEKLVKLSNHPDQKMWYLVRNESGLQGYVPASYVMIEEKLTGLPWLKNRELDEELPPVSDKPYKPYQSAYAKTSTTSAVTEAETKWFCEVCQKKFNGPQPYGAHMTSKAHKEEVEAQNYYK